MSIVTNCFFPKAHMLINFAADCAGIAEATFELAGCVGATATGPGFGFAGCVGATEAGLGVGVCKPGFCTGEDVRTCNSCLTSSILAGLLSSSSSSIRVSSVAMPAGAAGTSDCSKGKRNGDDDGSCPDTS